MDQHDPVSHSEVVARLQEENLRLRAALSATDHGNAMLLQSDEFSRLLSLSKLIVAELDLAKVFELVAENAREIVKADQLLVPMLNERRDRYTYAAASGLDAELVRGTSFAANVGMCGWVLQHEQSLLFGETSTRWLDERTTWEAGQQSAVLVPVFGRKGIIGGLSALGKQGGGCFTQHDLELLTMFANQVSIAIENARLFQQVSREVEERKLAEREAHESRNLLRQILNAMPQSVFWKDARSAYLGCNEVFARTVGLGAPEKIVGKTDRDLPWPEHEAEAYRSDDLEVMLGNQPKLHIREPLQRADGSRIWIDTCKVPLLDREGRVFGILGVFEDITEREQAESRLRRSEQLVRSILDTVDEGFIVVDRDYQILTANSAYCDQAGVPADRVVGKHCYEVLHRSRLPCYEAGGPCAVRDVFATGEPHTTLHEHADADGAVVYVETKAYPMKDDAGNVVSAIETVADITERRLLEEERLKTQKLESIGTLAGGIAHDFNNLLQGVFGYISMAKVFVDRRDKVLATLEQVENALHQSVKLTTQLLTFSRGGKPVRKLIDLRPVIEDSAKFTLSGSRSDLRLALPADLWPAEADDGQVAQVIQNIVMNADQSMPLGGTVIVTAKNLAAGDAGLPRGLGRGNYVAISIQDTGVGIPQQVLDKIFDPYFSTKQKGSGLGLATSYSIVRNHGGAIDVRTKPGDGSTFTVYLPAHHREERAAAAGTSEEAQPTRAARVLVMDDEELIRRLTGQLLEVLGHHAEVARHGQEALEKYRAAMTEGHPFDVVILDLTVRGGMGGEETLARLRELDPSVRAIVSSGYSDDASMADHLTHGFKAFLNKPYNLEALRDVVMSVLV